MQVELRAGETVAGKYRIERLLGRGAVGTVYRAEHVETGKRVALKCVDASDALDPASADRLVREAQAAARIRHTNVVDVYDVGRDGKLIFLVMEYLEGEPLSALIARDDFAPNQLIALLLPAMRGVAEAHRQGVVHRDIKPDNIFLAQQIDARHPIAKVLDFGISKLDARGLPMRKLTADGYAIGTPGYMAYEQAMGDKSIDGRADVYAFGAILYEAFTGRVPHSAVDFPALLAHFLTQPVASPIELGERIPEPLNALIMWALERERDQRIPSMETLIRELEPFAHERSYRSSEPKVSPRGLARTLVGPWGMNKPALSKRGAPRVSATAPTHRATVPALPPKRPTAPTKRESSLWLQRLRTRRARTLALAGALAALVLAAGLFFALEEPEPRAAQPRAQTVQHSVSALRTEAPQTLGAEAAPELPRGAAPPEGADTQPAQAAAPPAQPELEQAKADAPSKPLPDQPAQNTATALPPNVSQSSTSLPPDNPRAITAAPAPRPAPAPNKPQAPRAKPALKARDFGIY